VTEPATYRRYAQQYLQGMETVTEPGGKAVFFATAQMWNALADQAERNDSTEKGPPQNSKGASRD
jgi:hypothetical protein